MPHLCDTTVARPTAQRDNVLASNCEYPPLPLPPFKCARGFPLCPPVLPKGPFRTKNSTALESVVLCYRRTFSLLYRFPASFA